MPGANTRGIESSSALVGRGDDATGIGREKTNPAMASSEDDKVSFMDLVV
jgi:hypothetical protein